MHLDACPRDGVGYCWAALWGYCGKRENQCAFTRITHPDRRRTAVWERRLAEVKQTMEQDTDG